MRFHGRIGLASMCIAVSSVATPGRPALAGEVVVKNDSITDGSNAAIQAGFVAGESAAAWLTSPCGGRVVAVQIFWRSLTGTTGQSLEDSITIYTGGSFPVPGGFQVVLEGPVMTDGVLNEFRYLDENSTIPIDVPVNLGQTFVVSFRFANSPSPTNGPSVVTDADGCQNGRNGIFAIPPSVWFNACSLGVSGDFFIRAVVDCPDAQGACCLPDGTCVLRSENQCTTAGGIYRGDNTTCGAATCNGACCRVDGSCVVTSAGDCAGQSGTFRGVDTTCTPNPCVGACCLPDGSCADGMTQAACVAAGGAYKGDTVQCNAVFCSGACCYADGTCIPTTLGGCNASDGEWQGPTTNCITFNCPVRGACCLPDGSCLDFTTAAQCQAQGGFYKGDGTTCGANPCTGACCFSGSTCLDFTRADCEQISGSVWQGPAFACNPGNLCPTGACCMPDGSCAEAVTPAGCTALGGSYRNGLTCAQANCPIPRGACCLAGGGCINNLTPGDCGLIPGGAWAGANTVCRCDCYPTLSGDLNNDGLLDSLDIRQMVFLLMGGTAADNLLCRADYDNDNALTPGDIPGMVAALLAVP